MAITLGPQFLINTQTGLDQDNVSLAGLANGLFVAAYEAQVPTNLGGVFDGIDFQVFNADGTKRGGEINQTAQLGIFNTFDPDVVAPRMQHFMLHFSTSIPPASEHSRMLTEISKAILSRSEKSAVKAPTITPAMSAWRSGRTAACSVSSPTTSPRHTAPTSAERSGSPATTTPSTARIQSSTAGRPARKRGRTWRRWRTAGS